MRLIVAVYDALASFDRPATRRELERESGLDPRAVSNGLLGLHRRGLLGVSGASRMRATYWLLPGAKRPEEDLRGRYERDDAHRAHMSALRTGRYSPARPPSHAAEPGRARALKAELLRSAQPLETSCLLERLWRRR